jgi:hypothetical protein
MANMNKYAKWMTENSASIHSGGGTCKNKANNAVSGKYAIVFDSKTGLKWTTGHAAELNAAIEAAIAKTKDTPRPLHENDAAAVALAAQLAEAKARIAELEKKSVKAPAKSDEDEIEGPSGLSVAQAASARLKK